MRNVKERIHKKCHSLRLKDEIRTCKDAVQAHILGLSPRPDFLNNWEDLKVTVMKRVLREKFLQHENLRKVLLGTRSCIYLSDVLDTGTSEIVHRDNSMEGSSILTHG